LIIGGFRNRIAMKGLISLLLLTNILVAQQATVNYVDVVGKKQGLWVFTNVMVNGTCDDGNQKVSEGEFKDSKKTGIWKEYYCNKLLKSKITYTNNRPDGYAIVYHENGKVKEEGEWKNNRWMGVYKLYYPNGQVQQSFNFDATGKRVGKQTYYHENGQVMIEGVWEAGKESGLVKEYYENGDLKSIKDFTGGVIDNTKTQTFQPKKPLAPVKELQIPAEDLPPPPVVKKAEEKQNLGKPFDGEGYWQLYNSNKQITKDGIFKHNKFIEGKTYFYDDGGILVRIAVYKGGKYVGDGLIAEEQTSGR
jgi:antitoxin component YwqK of YwqJK toxin-antitoxin module